MPASHEQRRFSKLIEQQMEALAAVDEKRYADAKTHLRFANVIAEQLQPRWSDRPQAA